MKSLGDPFGLLCSLKARRAFRLIVGDLNCVPVGCGSEAHV